MFCRFFFSEEKEKAAQKEKSGKIRGKVLQKHLPFLKSSFWFLFLTRKRNADFQPFLFFTKRSIRFMASSMFLRLAA